jgi:putative hydrolase of the HAD superfamily
VTIRAVFLDVDDTLVDYQYAATSAFHEMLGDDADYNAFFGLDHYDRYLSGELGYEDARVQRMTTYLAMFGRDDEDPAALEAGRIAALEKYYVLYDDALACIRALRERDLRIGLITNNEAVHQRRKIEAVELDRLVDTAVISGELGIAKPDARIFAHACAQLDVAPREAMHIGDALYADALGAHDAGLRAVWLDRTGASQLAPLAFPVITGLGAVTELID